MKICGFFLNRDISNHIFFQKSIVYYFAFIFLASVFLFHLFILVKKLWKFCSVLLDRLEILSTNYGKF